MEEYAEIIRSEIKVQDIQTGWLRTQKQCCYGEQILEKVVQLVI